MVGDLNDKHVQWNSRLIITKGRVFCNCANENCCLIYGPDTPTTVSYNFIPIPDALDTVIAKDPVTPVYLTMCSRLRADHLPVLINTRCWTDFLNPLDCPNLRTDWSKFYVSLEVGLPSNPGYWCVSRNCEVLFQRCWQSPLPSVVWVMDHSPRYWLVLRIKYAWRTSLGGSGKSQGLRCLSLSPAMQ